MQSFIPGHYYPALLRKAIIELFVELGYSEAEIERLRKLLEPPMEPVLVYIGEEEDEWD